MQKKKYFLKNLFTSILLKHLKCSNNLKKLKISKPFVRSVDDTFGNLRNQVKYIILKFEHVRFQFMKFQMHGIILKRMFIVSYVI